MTARPRIDTMEATRLTREGRLDEAMAVLRGTLVSPPVPRTDGDARQCPGPIPLPLLDVMPSLRGEEASSPDIHEASPPGLRRVMSQPRIQEALRGLFDRIRPLKALCRLDGVIQPGMRPPTPLPDGARFEERSYANAAGSRTYKLYVPSGYNGRALPLVVMLHGCTQSPDDFAAGTRMNAVAEEQTFLVAYPAQPPSANASKCWNWFNGGDQQRDRGEPALIAGITQQIMADFPVERGRVYVAGLSAGGAAAAIMGSTYPELYAAIGVHSGLACGVARDIPTAFAAMRQGGFPSAESRRGKHPVPTIVFHGDRDMTVNPINADHVIAQSKAAAELSTKVNRGETPAGIKYTRSIQADEDGQPVLEQWVLHGAGHAWSGGSPAGSYTEPRGPDASREMVRFFFSERRTSAYGRGSTDERETKGSYDER